MTGLGKGAKGLGTGSTKYRHRRISRRIAFITKPSLQRVARRGGVKRASGHIYEETHGALRIYLREILHDSVSFAEHCDRHTVTTLDVVNAVRRSGSTLYGFDS